MHIPFVGFQEGLNLVVEPARPHKRRMQCVVAIPTKDEAERLPACLTALANQIDASGRRLDPESFGVVVFANNCCDGSAALARTMGEELSLRLRVVEVMLPPGLAHAGGARGGAMDEAAGWLAAEGARNGVILTTDADSQVSPLWIANTLSAIEAGVDAVLGHIQLDEEGDRLPEALHRRGRLENAYESLLAETAALLDPLAHDPWPHHSTIAGASLAVTRDAYLRIGGLPRVPLGEDKALVAALSRIDAKTRHSPDVLVTTSGRCQGRAPGGVADTLRLRSEDPSALCDEALESYRVAFTRAKWRGRLRTWRRSGGAVLPSRWARALQVPQSRALRSAAASTFGAAWSEIESHSPRFFRRPLAPAELPGQIAVARRAVHRLRQIASASGEHIEPKFAMPISAIDASGSAHGADEKLGGLVAG